MHKKLAPCVVFFIVGLLFAGEPPFIIGIQPLGTISEELLTVIFKGIESVYNAQVVFSMPVSMPAQAFYAPRSRYRADSLLHYLDAHGDPQCTKVIGITTYDISTTKAPHKDWGIFGLGSLGGFSCVVSTYRLKAGNVSTKIFHERLIKVINHELGHTIGLPHCSYQGCLMEDAKGKIATVDNESEAFCPDCRVLLTGKLK